MWIGHRKEIWKLAFRALALRRSESRNWGLCVVYIQKDPINARLTSIEKSVLVLHVPPHGDKAGDGRRFEELL